MIAKTIYTLLLITLIGGCSSTPLKTHQLRKANTLLIEAYKLSQNGSPSLAINKVNDAIKLARNSQKISNELIEAYDDLGLYHFLQKDYKKSAYHQSIAVVLSHFNNPKNKMNNVYLERLGWAYAKYDPTFNLTNFIASPLLLVCTNQLNIQKNADIRQFLYERDTALSIRRTNKLGMLTLKTGIC